MYAGFDFGTSKCSIGLWKDASPVLIPLENGNLYIPSTLYTSKSVVAVEEIDEDELKRRVSKAKAQQAKEAESARREGRPFILRTEEELKNHAHGTLRRELAQRSRTQFDSQSLIHSLYSDSEVIFGEAAIRTHLTDPQSGYFIKSPKSFLGADIKRHHLELFAEVITRMLANIKHVSEEKTGAEIEQIVLGRPINFDSTRMEVGNKQAIGILQRAAAAAGFKQVEFLYEPIAAALDYERTLDKDRTVLVLDAGGGTTDCSVIRVGPSYRERVVRSDTILGCTGGRVGGSDIDVKLAMRTIMPHFGKGSLLNTGLPIPNALFWDAVSVNDVNAQARFASDAMARELSATLACATEKKKVSRLQKLHKGRQSYRLNRSSELAKIHLSDRDQVNLPLRYIEPELLIEVTRNDLKQAANRELNVFVSLMREAVRQAQTDPDVIYVTGGTAKSPVVSDFIRSEFYGVEIVVGDLFGSVASGLTTWAHRIYQ